jgi:hypothetical protein
LFQDSWPFIRRPHVFEFQGIELFACGVAWLILNAGAIFLCMWIKLKVWKHDTCVQKKAFVEEK